MNSFPGKLRLSTLVTLAVCATVALTVALQMALVNHFAVRQAREEAQLRLQQLSWQMRDSLNRVIEKALGDTRLLAELPQIRHARDTREARTVLESLQRTFPDYAWIGIADLDGKVTASTGSMLEGANVAKRPWFTAGMRGVHASDYHPAVLLEKILPRRPDPWRFVDASGPIVDLAGNPTGVLGLHLSWEWARVHARKLLTPALREYGAEIIVIRDDGTVMLGPQSLVESRVDTTSLRLAQKGMTGSLREVWPDGRAYLTGYSQTGDMLDASSLRWTVLVRQTEDRAMEGTVDLKHRMLAWSALLALLLAGAAALAARRLTRPIAELREAIERVTAATNAGQEPPPIPQVDGFLETQILSATMRDLVRSETAHRHALLALNEGLEAAVAERTAELQALLLRDVLTGLPNRRALLEALPEAMNRARRVGRPCALLFLDMDGFKAVNDSHGHEEGDELLRQFGARLLQGVRKTDMVARLAGDEFVVVLEMLTDAAHAEETARKLLGVLNEPFLLHRASVRGGASIGIALHRPEDLPDVDAWLARADHAMYAVKRTGKNGVALAAAL
ncbi:sensor domain-containing diguanylate cyclase [Massilia yuzhufengensis]|uniref:Diguanylate cyclase (GGDEF) domain-containing protein n=1 Tax=Massilia yuzhufengensis TaxID=1164594 RepID=A0A1I1JSM4_9BURK|nr:sensor domain-containing diguanylate cyclase [Massilia yuzhufengensis]SFC50952.1 diguanylate cyclase (GGDEF) domain-containing protein [Massilia yuzhufengensis]